MVLRGAAALEVDGERLELGAREWLFLPSGVPHTVLHADPGTDWLAVRLHPDGREP